MAEADRRSERTRQAVLRAFMVLLSERGFAKLTICEVIERANIGRSTFYEHYRTKYDLLRQSLAGPFGVLAAAIGQSSAPPELVPLLEHFRFNQALCRELFLPRTRPVVSRALTECIEPKLVELCARWPAAAPMVPMGLIALQLAEAQLCLVESWALRRNAASAEQIAAALCASCYAAGFALLGLPAGAA